MSLYRLRAALRSLMCFLLCLWLCCLAGELSQVLLRNEYDFNDDTTPHFKREKHFYTNNSHSCELAISFKLTT